MIYNFFLISFNLLFIEFNCQADIVTLKFQFIYKLSQNKLLKYFLNII